MKRMNRRKINWGLSIVLLYTMASFFWSTWIEIEESNFKYGKDFNEVRESLRIPKIEENWISHGSYPTSRFWADPGRAIKTTAPHHSSKTSEFDGTVLVSENDDFHYQANDSIAFRVIFEYHFIDSSWHCELIKYKKGKYPPTESWDLTLSQADSIIDTWGLSR